MSLTPTAPVAYDVIHFSDKFPVEQTKCGLTRVPAAELWRYVTCLECLDRAPKDPRIEARRQHVIEEERQRRSSEPVR